MCTLFELNNHFRDTIHDTHFIGFDTINCIEILF